MADAKKGALKSDRTLLFADEAGIGLLPAGVQTWAPVGQTPILEATVSRDHLSMMAAITPEGQLYTQTLDQAFNGARVVRFLRHLLRQITGPLTRVWDGAPIHRSKEVKALLSEVDAKRLHLVRLPGYAPELNPTEAVWSYLKYTELANLASRDLTALRDDLHKATERLRDRPHLLQSFFRLLDLY